MTIGVLSPICIILVFWWDMHTHRWYRASPQCIEAQLQVHTMNPLYNFKIIV